jgi:hypothetical protein
MLDPSSAPSSSSSILIFFVEPELLLPLDFTKGFKLFKEFSEDMEYSEKVAELVDGFSPANTLFGTIKKPKTSSIDRITFKNFIIIPPN